ncbi:MAG: CoA-binding protein [Ignisphaera sp.]|jgi:succinyl-CoA synthetase alpha subunit|nr:CoA-binding protein [Ignisphaera sp.]MCC6056953.1 CoA-binding protein [Desulfurococcaceae archaeon]
MAILINENTSVLVQGITGRTGAFGTRAMLEYGTKVVAGVTPGRKGETVWGVPVFNTVKEAVSEVGPIDLSVTFVPAPQVKDAVLEALEAGIKTIVIPAERVPLHDILTMVSYAKKVEARIIGPGSLGLISPGKASAGWIGGARELMDEAFRPGNVGVISRSGGGVTTVCWLLVQHGLGVSTAVHVGTEPIIGTTGAELLRLFQEDSETHAVAVFGEIGGLMEIEMAEVIKRGEFKKPLVVYIAGRMLPSGIRFSHASAIIERRADTAEYKEKMLTDVGAYVAKKPEELATITKHLVRR